MSSASTVKAGGAYVELTTRDSKLRAGLASAETRLQRFGASVQTLQARLGRVGYGFARAGQRVGAASSAMIGAGARVGAVALAMGGGLVFAIKKAMDLGDQLDKMSQRTGASIEWLSVMRYVAEQNGASIEQVEKAITGMQKSIADASQGRGRGFRWFGELGLQIRDLESMNPEQQFDALAEAIGGVEDAAKRTRIATAILSDSGSAILPLLGAPEFEIKVDLDTARAKKDLKKLGLDAEKLKLLTPDVQYNQVRSALTMVGDDQQRRGMRRNLLKRERKDSPSPMQASREEAKNLGLGMTRDAALRAVALGDALARLKFVMERLYVAVGVHLSPVLEKMVNSFAGWLPRVGDFLDKNGGAIVSVAKLTAIMGALALAITTVGVLLKPVAVGFNLLGGSARVAASLTEFGWKRASNVVVFSRNTIKTASIASGSAMKYLGGAAKSLGLDMLDMAKTASIVSARVGVATARMAAAAAVNMGRLGKLFLMTANLIPFVEGGITKLVRSILGSSTGVPRMLLKGGTMVASSLGSGLLGAYKAVGAVALGVWEAVSGAAPLGAILSQVGAALLSIVAILGWTLPIIIGIAVTAYRIYKHWDLFTETMRELGSAIRKVASGMWELMKATVKTFAAVVKTVFTAIWNTIKTALSLIWSGIKWVWEPLKNFWGDMKALLADSFGMIAQAFRMGDLATVWEIMMLTAISALFTILKHALKMVSDMTKFFIDTFIYMDAQAATIFEGLWYGIKVGWGALTGWLGYALDMVWLHMKHSGGNAITWYLRRWMSLFRTIAGMFIRLFAFWQKNWIRLKALVNKGIDVKAETQRIDEETNRKISEMKAKNDHSEEDAKRNAEQKEERERARRYHDSTRKAARAKKDAEHEEAKTRIKQNTEYRLARNERNVPLGGVLGKVTDKLEKNAEKLSNIREELRKKEAEEEAAKKETEAPKKTSAESRLNAVHLKRVMGDFSVRNLDFNLYDSDQKKMVENQKKMVERQERQNELTRQTNNVLHHIATTTGLVLRFN